MTGAIVFLSACCLPAFAGDGYRPASLEELRSRAAEEAYFSESPAILNALVKAGGTAAVPILEQLLRDDKTYWNNLGLNLDDAEKIPAVRVERTLAILHHLATLGYSDREQVVRGLRDQFADHPLLQRHLRIIEASDGIVSRR